MRAAGKAMSSAPTAVLATAPRSTFTTLQAPPSTIKVRGPPLYSGLGDCPNISSFLSRAPKRCPPVYTDTEAALFTRVPRLVF
jgi:hypothetical protein